VKARLLGKSGAFVAGVLLVVCVSIVSFLVISYQLDAGFAGQTSNKILPSAEYGKEELTAYALSLINSDRQAANLRNVTLSRVTSAQEHADDMLEKGYFSHWDTEGYKPYVRYTLAGGRGVVAENVAVQFGSSLDAKASIRDLEWSMMNDDGESNWEHRNNILDAFHNSVGIGVAYDGGSVYLVQDFEDYYVQGGNFSVSNRFAVLTGNFVLQNLTIGQVDVYFDNWCSLSASALGNPPFNGSYDFGTFVGSVAGSGLVLTEGILVPPKAWNQLGTFFQVSFDLSQFFSRGGRGIYTLRLWSSSGECLTNYSFFFSG
jgi:uncharacterized protein YkwD